MLRPLVLADFVCAIAFHGRYIIIYSTYNIIYPSAISGIIVAVVVIHESKLGIIHFAAPLDALGDIPLRSDLSVG